MPLAVASPLPPILVGNTLRSSKQGDVGELGEALDRAARASTPASGTSADLQERLELIGAIASELRSTVRRSQRLVPSDGIDVFLPLLQNLAACGGGLT